MSENESHHELDDELLSAYVDDELSADERAAVEARLAADPAAQHCSQQLRSVSQSVQALPQRTIPHDLSERILRRVEEAKRASRGTPAATRVAPDGESSGLGDAMPKITLFRTPRSWFWASLAVAAGLMIMVLQSGDELTKVLPAVAQRDTGMLANQPAEVPAQRELSERARQRADPHRPRPLHLRPRRARPLPHHRRRLPPTVARTKTSPRRLDQPLLNARANCEPKSWMVRRPATPLAAASPTQGNRGVELKVNGESRLATTTAGQPPADKLSDAPQVSGRDGGAGGALGGALGKRPESTEETSPLVVVHVVAKRRAIENKTFEQLLVTNGIAVEAESLAEVKSGIASDRFARKAKTENPATVEAAGKMDEDESAGYAVLVEAPQTTILSCVAGLNKDLDNYVSLEVDESPTPADRGDKAPAPTKKLTTDLGKFSRGIVSERQKEMVRGGQFYYDRSASENFEKSKLGLGGGIDKVGDVKQLTEGIDSSGRGPEGITNLGRARRIQPSEFEDRTSGESPARGRAYRGPGADDVAKLSRSTQALKSSIVTKNGGQMQALFVVSPEDAAAATSAPAEKSAK